jgi:hypothetical protein
MCVWRREQDGIDLPVFWPFLVTNIVLVVWALVDAIRVPEDSMYQAGGSSCGSW